MEQRDREYVPDAIVGRVPDHCILVGPWEAKLYMDRAKDCLTWKDAMITVEVYMGEEIQCVLRGSYHLEQIDDEIKDGMCLDAMEENVKRALMGENLVTHTGDEPLI